MTIMQRMLAVMQDVGAVRKGEKNAAQGFNFRGIDSVVNAVAPALKKNGVLVVPALQSVEYAQVEVGKNRTPMLQCRVIVQYVFAAEDGTTLAASVAAEALDSGDKATAKAMSVAFRTALLQALCLPTDEPDPDHDVYERAAQLPEMDRDSFDRAMAAIVKATEEGELSKIEAALGRYAIRDEWAAALGEAIQEKRADRD
jgi:hypothetical protein